MPDNLKLGVSLLVLVSILFLSLFIMVFFMKENEKDKRLAMEVRLGEILREKDELEKGLDELRLVNKDLESKLLSAEQERKSLAEDYAREKERYGLLDAKLEEEKKEVKKLVSEIMAEKEEKVGIVQKLAQAENDYQKLKEQFDMVVRAKETMEKKLKEIVSKKGVELPKIVVEPGGLAEIIPEFPTDDTSFSVHSVDAGDEEFAFDGEVLVVNKKFDFVIVNLGKSDGLKLGKGLQIYREEDLIAEAQIEKLYDRMCAATVLPQYKKASIKQGDNVVISR